MGTEIERKFLVRDAGWTGQAIARRTIRQAYLARTDHSVVRIRIIDDTDAVITIKGEGLALARPEFEYAIPLEDARQLFDLRIGQVIEKHRHLVPAGALQWEVDQFVGVHEGLILAEIELRSEGDRFPRPNWLGEEVTGDARYYNSTLALGNPR